METPNERWAPVRGFPLYEVSDRGRVRSWNAGAGRGPACDGRRERPLMMKSRVGAKGRPLVNFWSAEQGAKAKFVHTVVLEAFVGPRPEGQVCRHLNGDPLDNRLENLKWGTLRENSADIRRHRGVSDDEMVAAILLARRGMPTRILGEVLGYSASAVAGWVREAEGASWLARVE